MDSLGKKSAAYICYLIINFFWYVSCFFGILLPGAFIYDYFWSSHPDTIFGINAPISAELVSLNNPETYSFLSVDAVKGTVDFGYILEQSPDIYIYWSLLICLAYALYLIGFYQLRNLLKSSVYEAVFTRANIRRIKVIAFLIMLGAPLEWIQQHYILEKVGAFVTNTNANTNMEIYIGTPEFGYLLTGLLIFVLATVFEKGYEMYQELKLTV